MLKNLDQIIQTFRYCDIICCSETWLKPEINQSLIFFPGKKIFRLDRKLDNGKTRGGGVCIFVSEKLAPYVAINEDCTRCSKDYEILTINISKPNMRFFIVSCIYKPPTGKNVECIDFMKNIYKNTRREIWLLGDFNVDFLDRNSDQRLKYINAFKVIGIKQLVSTITRPNHRGGTCIDWIATNSEFVNASGVLDILISDHLPVYCIRKKKVRDMHMCIGLSEIFLTITLMFLLNLYGLKNGNFSI